MAVKFNPFTGQLQIDEKGSGGGSSYIDGEVAAYGDLSLDAGVAPLNSAWLVREASGTWLLGRKPAGIYIRTATAGVSRDADYTYAGILPDVFSDANFLLYDNGDSTKNLQFQLSGISTGTTRTLTVPNANGTIATTAQLTDVKVYTANDTWTKPAGARLIHLLMIGAGGGGGAGRRGAAGTDRFGGGGGAGGGVPLGDIEPRAGGGAPALEALRDQHQAVGVQQYAAGLHAAGDVALVHAQQPGERRPGEPLSEAGCRVPSPCGLFRDLGTLQVLDFIHLFHVFRAFRGVRARGARAPAPARTHTCTRSRAGARNARNTRNIVQNQRLMAFRGVGTGSEHVPHCEKRHRQAAHAVPPVPTGSDCARSAALNLAVVAASQLGVA